jgi:hypothetical protein
MTKKLVDRQVRINLYPFKNSPFMLEAFQKAAKEQEWGETEITLVSNQTKGLTLEHKYEVLLRYCHDFAVESEFTQEDVLFMCDHLNNPTHYLAQKSIEKWDEYDWSNYRSLKRKATTRIRRVFALFTESVREKDKYVVQTPPSIHYDTMEEALEAVPVGQESITNIYPLWIKE